MGSAAQATECQPVGYTGDPGIAKPAVGSHLPVVSEGLAAAVRDYRLLLDRGFPVAATIKLVGDRYRLDKIERNILFRGVLDKATSASIAARRVPVFEPGRSLAIDGYNVLFTLINYRRGHPLFVSTDGLVRDAGGAHGRIGRAADFDDALHLLAPVLAAGHASFVTIYLDAPVSGSGSHAAAIRAALTEHGLACAVQVVPSADPWLIDFDGQIVASSDSVVAMRARAQVHDLARTVLEQCYGAVFLDLGRLL